jgi:hypothetical protein
MVSATTRGSGVGGPALVEDVRVAPVGNDGGYRGDQVGKGQQAAPGLAAHGRESHAIMVLSAVGDG